MNKEELLKENEKLKKQVELEVKVRDDIHWYLTGIIDNLMEENKQLKDNWNKLKEHYKRKVEETKNSTALYDKWTRYSSILSKMNELERSDSNE